MRKHHSFEAPRSQLRSRDREVRLAGLRDLAYGTGIEHTVDLAAGRMYGAAEVVPDVVPMLRDPDRQIRRIAADVLGSIGPAGRDAVPALIRAMRDPEDDTFAPLHAGTALLRITGSPENVAAALVRALDSPDAGLRRDAAHGLGKYNNALFHWSGALPIDRYPRRVADSILPPLAAALRDADAAVRRDAARVAGYWVQPPSHVYADLPSPRAVAAALPHLSAGLRDRDVAVRRHVTVALRELGVKAKAAVPDLRRALHDEDEAVRATAAEALVKTDDDGALLSTLLRELRSADPGVRRGAGEEIGRTAAFYTRSWLARRSWWLPGAAFDRVVPALAAALGDADAGVRVEAAAALGEIGAVVLMMHRSLVPDRAGDRFGPLAAALREAERVAAPVRPDLAARLHGLVGQLTGPWGPVRIQTPGR